MTVPAMLTAENTTLGVECAEELMVIKYEIVLSGKKLRLMVGPSLL
jgi:hypothetical protein